MKFQGPIVLLLIGAFLCGVSWVSGQGSVDHNIGRSIANSIIRQGAMILGAGLAVCGVIWALTRWSNPPPNQ